MSKLQDGTKVKLRNGWIVTITDDCIHAKVRRIEVEGFFIEHGAIKIDDIVEYLDPWGVWQKFSKHEGEINANDL